MREEVSLDRCDVPAAPVCEEQQSSLDVVHEQSLHAVSKISAVYYHCMLSLVSAPEEGKGFVLLTAPPTSKKPQSHIYELAANTVLNIYK